MMLLLRGYIRTLRQYASSPKTQYEYKHYALLLLLFLMVLLVVWGGIYLYNGYT